MHSFCSGRLLATETIMCAEHIEICLECQQLFNQLSIINVTSRSGSSIFSPDAFILGEHVDYEQISDYLDNKLDRDRVEFVKPHLDYCPVCSAEMSSLKEFRKTIEAELWEREEPQDFITKVKSIFRRIEFPNPVYLFGALSILIILGIVTFVLYRWMIQDKDQHTKSPAYVTPGPQSPRDDPERKDSKNDPTSPSGQVVINRPTDRTEVIYDTGKRYVVSYYDDRISVSNLAPELRLDAAKVMKGQTIADTALLEELAQPEMDVRGGDDDKKKIVLVSPVGTVIVEDRPVLKWRPIEDASSYVVDIVDETFSPVAQSPQLEGTQWAVKESLKRDTVYMWQVTAYRDGERIEGRLNQIGKFKVVSEGKLIEVGRARRRYTSHFELGVYYLREGLLDEAEREFRRVLARNPSSKLVERISTMVLQGRR